MYGEVKLISRMPKGIKNNSHFECEFECLNCGAKIKRQYRYRKSKHRCSSFRVHKNGIKEKWCFKCDTWLELAFFQHAGHVHGGFSKTCRSCRKIYMDRAEETRKKRDRERYLIDGQLPKRKFTLLLSRLKHRAFNKNLAFDLDIEFLMRKWRQQKGKCFYTNLDMRWKVGGSPSFYSASLDRRNPNKGYTKRNVVFVLYGVNSFKQRLPETEFLMLMHDIKWKS